MMIARRAQIAFANAHKTTCVEANAHDVSAGSMWYHYRPQQPGCDIAAATGQEPGFDPAAATLALDAAHQFLLPEYRGPESFGEIVPVPDDAPVLDRFLGFLGRRPLTA